MSDLSMSNDGESIRSDDSRKALPSQINWLNASSGITVAETREFPLYTDAHITGEFSDGLGPYYFLNTVPLPEGPGVVKTPIILRMGMHLGDYRPDMSTTDESFYHGGTLVDELAALVSVALGVRIWAGGEARRFESGKDPFGRPRAWNDEPIPVVRLRKNRLILPSVVGTHSLDQLEILKLVPLIASNRYVSLIRACKAYQDALWVAESEPNLSWLMLVSALETAANDVYALNAPNNVRLRDSKPELAALLDSHGGSELVDQVAELIAHTLGATKKFIDFTLRYMPAEPEQRPDKQWLRIDWSSSKLKKMLSKVYEYRSRALHGGIPFPAPMFESPFYFGPNSQPSELPLPGIASHSRGGTWLHTDVPLNLHCFHYIARGALLKWWQSLSN